MAEHPDREHFIPLRKADLVDLLCREMGLHTPAERQASEFVQLSRILEAILHYEYHDHLERLKNGYAPFDPDADTKTLVSLSPEQKATRLNELIDQFIWLLERANFKRLSHDEITAALHESTDWGLNLDVDFSVFDRLEIFARGQTTVTRTRKRWTNWYREEVVEVPIYRRLVVILRLKPHKRLPRNIDAENVYIKVFKDIPQMDLEMLLPGTRPRMTMLDQGKIGLPLATGIGLTGYKVFTGGVVLLSALTNVASSLTLLTLAGGTIGYGIKSYYGYQRTKQRYQLTLTESLYFHNLDNNAGVLFRLLDDAEEQENREALLAYYFLWREAGSEGWLPRELDDRIEQFLEKAAGITVDFEIGDALDKLKRLGMVELLPNDRLRAIAINQALAGLDRAWDNYFDYHQPGRDGTPSP